MEDLTSITKEYYNRKDTDEFYHQIWGGDDMHIGIYHTGDETIREASTNTALKMIKLLPSIKKSYRILDIGAGYGGAARLLAEKFNCHVDCLNLSEIENKRNIAKNKKAGLEELITVTTGNFEEIPFERETYDIVWSQDALLHSEKKQRVFREVTRVLKSEGRFIFTDPMQADHCPPGVLEPILSRFHLKELGSIKHYRRLTGRLDLEKVFVIEMPDQLVIHYKKVLEQLEKDYKKLSKKLGDAYLKQTIEDVKHWIDAGQNSYLNWGILQFQKRNADRM